MQIEVNMNTEARAVLSCHGVKTLEDHYRDLGLSVSKYVWLNHDPETRTVVGPLYDLFLVFGRDFYMGNARLPFVNNEIVLEVTEGH